MRNKLLLYSADPRDVWHTWRTHGRMWRASMRLLGPMTRGHVRDESDAEIPRASAFGSHRLPASSHRACGRWSMVFLWIFNPARGHRPREQHRPEIPCGLHTDLGRRI